jgi:hypothetical protein
MPQQRGCRVQKKENGRFGPRQNQTTLNWEFPNRLGLADHICFKLKRCSNAESAPASMLKFEAANQRRAAPWGPLAVAAFAVVAKAVKGAA